MHVTLIRAWPQRHDVLELELEENATLRDAVLASQWKIEGNNGFAVFGISAHMETVLQEADRVEILRPLLADPKDARRQRALGSKARE